MLSFKTADKTAL